MLAVAAITRIVQADEQHLRLDPVQRLHQRAKVEQGEGAGIDQEIEFGMSDDFRGFALGDHLHAMRGPIAVMQLGRVHPPDGMKRRGGRAAVGLSGRRLGRRKRHNTGGGQMPLEGLGRDGGDGYFSGRHMSLTLN